MYQSKLSIIAKPALDQISSTLKLPHLVRIYYSESLYQFLYSCVAKSQSNTFKNFTKTITVRGSLRKILFVETSKYKLSVISTLHKDDDMDFIEYFIALARFHQGSVFNTSTFSYWLRVCHFASPISWLWFQEAIYDQKLSRNTASICSTVLNDLSKGHRGSG